ALPPIGLRFNRGSAGEGPRLDHGDDAPPQRRDRARVRTARDAPRARRGGGATLMRRAVRDILEELRWRGVIAPRPSRPKPAARTLPAPADTTGGAKERSS